MQRRRKIHTEKNQLNNNNKTHTDTPFLAILFPDKRVWSVYLLGFIWFVALGGIAASAVLPQTKFKARLSLSLYLFMGWAAMLVMHVSYSKKTLELSC